MKKGLCLLLLLFGVSLTVFGQDKHFSQFYASPLTLNPALTGFIDGKYRISTIYRRQGQAVMADPFVTFAGTFDMRFKLSRATKKKDAIGAGIVFYADKAGLSEFTTNSMALSAAFHKALDMHGTQYLSGGLEMGLVQRSVNYAGLTFNDQFNGDTGYTLGTEEDLPGNNFTFNDLAVGIFYAISPEARQAVNFGLSVHHATRPDVSFVEDTKNRLFLKLTGQLGGQFPVSRKSDLMPRAIIVWQGPHLEINSGMNLKMVLSEYNKTRVHAGLWARTYGNDRTAIAGLDAIILSGAFQLEGLQIGLSYDINLSPLIKASSGQGGFEISVSYTGSYEDDTVICPSF